MVRYSGVPAMNQSATDNLKAGVALLGKRLSLDVRQIRRRCMVDPAFRALCEDYFLACQSRKWLQQQGADDAGHVVADYEAVIAELEREAAAALHARRDQGG